VKSEINNKKIIYIKIKIMTKKIQIFAAIALLMMTASCSKDDDAPIVATGITINKTELALAAGEHETLIAEITPNNAADKTVTWTSNAENVATVNNEGTVTAISSGNAIITATTANGETAVCNVKVQDIYVAGYEEDANEHRVAKLWKNGVEQPLQFSDNATASIATCVYVSGNDVYVTGFEDQDQYTRRVAKLWKNGVAYDLSADAPTEWDRSSAYGVYVENNDVYVVIQKNEEEYYTNTAALWKNGNVWDITDGTRSAHPRSLYVSGGDVYVAGWEWKENFTYLAKVWKNGVETALSDRMSFANSVYVSGSDVYASGYEEDDNEQHVAKVWKNGVATTLNSGAGYSEAYAVFVSGNDVYVAGEEDVNGNNLARLWKNGVATSLGDGARPACATSVYVSEGNVYVLGVELNSNNKSIAKVWKNGVEQNIINGTNSIYTTSLFVK
jgi:hypothetical protein